MHLDNGREIYECDKYPGYYIDEGDEPGGKHIDICTGIVYVSKSGKLYYPERNESATIPLPLEEAGRMRYKPSIGYRNYIIKQIRKKN